MSTAPPLIPGPPEESTLSRLCFAWFGTSVIWACIICVLGLGERVISILRGPLSGFTGIFLKRQLILFLMSAVPGFLAAILCITLFCIPSILIGGWLARRLSGRKDNGLMHAVATAFLLVAALSVPNLIGSPDSVPLREVLSTLGMLGILCPLTVWFCHWLAYASGEMGAIRRGLNDGLSGRDRPYGRRRSHGSRH